MFWWCISYSTLPQKPRIYFPLNHLDWITIFQVEGLFSASITDMAYHFFCQSGLCLMMIYQQTYHASYRESNQLLLQSIIHFLERHRIDRTARLFYYLSVCAYVTFVLFSPLQTPSRLKRFHWHWDNDRKWPRNRHEGVFKCIQPLLCFEGRFLIFGDQSSVMILESGHQGQMIVMIRMFLNLMIVLKMSLQLFKYHTSLGNR